MNEEHDEIFKERLDVFHKMQDTYIPNMNEELYLICLRFDYLDKRYTDINHLLGAKSDGDNLIVITKEYGKERILARDF